MISRDLVGLRSTESPLTLSVVDRETGERWVPGGKSETYYLEDVPSCRCCGEPAWPNLRCTKHQDRNPCAAEGCRRTRAANGDLRDDASLCGEHWRKFVPPGSPTRRAFNRLAAMAKKLGYKRTDRWPDELEDRWWRLWKGVMRRVRRGAEGHIDEEAIKRMFGWDA